MTQAKSPQRGNTLMRAKELVDGAHPDRETTDVIISTVLDKLTLLGRMTISSIGQTLQPKYKAAVWQQVIRRAVECGILRIMSAGIHTHTGRTSTVVWYEVCPEFQYEPLWNFPPTVVSPGQEPQEDE